MKNVKGREGSMGSAVSFSLFRSLMEMYKILLSFP
uniref:Uncharacterized protein n=1 Tax=Rhizophora mucronata TaxID=61149 RepID=A0A2P2PR20_RHIMU